MLCCEEGNSEMAELLLNSQADPNLQQSVSEIIIALYTSHVLYYLQVIEQFENLFIQGRLRTIAAPVCQQYCHKLERRRCPQTEESRVEIHTLGVIVAWFLAIGWLE